MNDSNTKSDPITHRSNMSKLWPDGKPRYREDGKVLKPSTYSKADVAGILDAAMKEPS